MDYKNRDADLISVIVPVYRVEAYLERSVSSIAAQSYRALEILLADDGSPDACGALCDEWAERDARILVLHKKNGGLSDARNAGMKAASGAYIGFVDSDDWIAPEMYERLCAAMQRDGSDVAACSVQMVWEDGSSPRLLTEEADVLLDREQAQKALLEERALKQPVWYKLYKSGLVRDLPFAVGKRHEDVYWSYQVIGRARAVSVIPYVGYTYLQRSGSIMGEGFSLKSLDAMEAYCRRCEYFRSAFPALADAALTDLWLRCIYYGQLALKDADRDTRRRAFAMLRGVRARYPIRHRQYRALKWTHRLWLSLSRLSLRLASRVKNLLGVGL